MTTEVRELKRDEFPLAEKLWEQHRVRKRTRSMKEYLQSLPTATLQQLPGTPGTLTG